MNAGMDYFCRMETPVNIYINERPLVIIDEDAALPPNAAVFSTPDDAVIGRTIDQLEKNELSSAVFRHSNPVSLFNQVKEHFTVFEAAGGLISNPAGEVLLMFRRGKWDLPKGKLDEGETLEACALREVQEETGLHNIYLNGKITENLPLLSLEEQKGAEAQSLVPHAVHRNGADHTADRGRHHGYSMDTPGKPGKVHAIFLPEYHRCIPQSRL